jgi:hypothetical protein
MSRRAPDTIEPGQAILVAWAGAIDHMIKVVEAAFREGFSAAQLGTADCETAWEASLSKVSRDVNFRISAAAMDAAL